MNTNTISLIDLSEAIWFNELQESSETTITKIQKWLSFNLGLINDLLQTDYKVDGNDANPQLALETAVILAALFMDYYYKNQIRLNTGASGMDVIEVREADSVVRLVNKTERAKVILQLKTDNSLYLNNLVNAYKRNQCIPASLKSGLWSNVCGCH